MKKKGLNLFRRVLLLALAIPFALLTGCKDDGNSLTLFTWDEMFPQEILEGFEKETGIRINYVNFDADEVMLTKLENSNGADYDLVIADDYIIDTVISKGLAQKLNKQKLPNYGNINPVYLKPFYDPTDEYTVPYGAGVQTIVYDPAKVNIKISGYGDLFDPSLANRVAIIANYRVINGMALKILGQSYNTEDLSAIRSAGNKLLSLAPNIRLIKDDHLEDELISGEVSAAVMYTSEVTAAMTTSIEKNLGFEMVFPKEGIGFGPMAGFIPSKAPNPDAAHAFLNYILDPERGALCFEHLGYYSTYAASDPYIDPELKPLLTLPAGFIENMENIKPIGEEADQEHLRIWTAFKAAAGKSDN
ncbi:periplasmic spermidine/putrescine-binding protein [Spirochaetia bacterium]|nr:periplasmic spermidine/putrescine-binding protein [Spirochaetia bacterium]